jgi:hypothetical protein
MPTLHHKPMPNRTDGPRGRGTRPAGPVGSPTTRESAVATIPRPTTGAAGGLLLRRDADHQLDGQAKGAPPAVVPFRVETRDGPGFPWLPLKTCPDFAAAVAALRQHVRRFGTDRLRVVPAPPTGQRMPLRHDDAAALLAARRDGVVRPPAFAALLGGPSPDVARRRASDALRRGREAGWLRACDSLGPGSHQLTAEGERLAAELERGTP